MNTNQLKKTKEKVKDQIRNNEIEDAFKTLGKLSTELGYSKLENRIILLENRYQHNKNTFHNIGTWDEEERNKIVLSLMEILNDVSEEKADDAHAISDESELQEKNQQIKALEKQIEDLVSSQLADIIVPENYNIETSNEFKFSFCYPKNWSFQRFPQQVFYGAIMDNSLNSSFQTNMNIVITDMTNNHIPFEQRYQQEVQQLLMMLQQSSLIFAEFFLFMGRNGTRTRINYFLNQPLTLYQITIPSKDHQKNFCISFTCLTLEFENRRLLFDNIISTLRL